jgi:primosomal protein N' (replication factor Y)
MTSFVDVAVPLGVRKTFAYSVPKSLIGRVSVGVRVLVPFGRKLVSGFVVACADSPPAGDFRIRPIREVLEHEPAIPAALVELALWVANYYFTAPGEVLRALLPAGSVADGARTVRLSDRARNLLSGGLRPTGLHAKEERVLDLLARLGEMNLKQLRAHEGLRDASQWIDSLAAHGWLHIEDHSLASGRSGPPPKWSHN